MHTELSGGVGRGGGKRGGGGGGGSVLTLCMGIGASFQKCWDSL